MGATAQMRRKREVKRTSTAVVLTLVAIALIVSPSMQAGIDTSGPKLVCASPPYGLDGPFCASFEAWLSAAALLLTAFAISAAPFAIGLWKKRRRGDGGGAQR